MRPDFITQEQITRWDENISNDKELTQAVSEEFVKNETLRELLYANLWMTENLELLKVDAIVIGACQNVLGKKSFGADPWQVAQTILEMLSARRDEIVNN